MFEDFPIYSNGTKPGTLQSSKISSTSPSLANEIIETSRIDIADIASAPVNWDMAFPSSEIQVKLERKEAFQPLKHFGNELSDESA